MAKKSQIERARISKRVDGIEMGTMADGTPFLSMRALCEFCGVSNKNLSITARAWADKQPSATGLGKMLLEAGVSPDGLLHHPVAIPGGTLFAFDARICQLVLEYYAHHAQGEHPQAVHSLRAMGYGGVGHWILHRLGIDPRNELPRQWQHYVDRVGLVHAPPGYFSVFAETSSLIVQAIRSDFPVNEHTVPDISIGRTWSDYWVKHRLADKYGERQIYDHQYPEYFPQAESNPQSIWVYPLPALGEFRMWFELTYKVEKLPAYISTKVQHGTFTLVSAEKFMKEIGVPLLGSKRKKKG